MSILCFLFIVVMGVFLIFVCLWCGFIWLVMVLYCLYNSSLVILIKYVLLDLFGVCIFYFFFVGLFMGFLGFWLFVSVISWKVVWLFW